MQGSSFPHHLQYTLTPLIYTATLSPPCDAEKSQPPVTNSPKVFGAGICSLLRIGHFCIVLERAASSCTCSSAILACTAASVVLHCISFLPGVTAWGAGHFLAMPCPSLKNNHICQDKLFWFVTSLQTKLFHWIKFKDKRIQLNRSTSHKNNSKMHFWSDA